MGSRVGTWAVENGRASTCMGSRVGTWAVENGRASTSQKLNLDTSIRCNIDKESDHTPDEERIFLVTRST
jgi:hypothetical protein